MDRRQRKTREAIFTAFTDLLTKKHYNKITVQEIIDAANVGRTTFYAHFETKDELLHEMCEDLFEHVFSDTPGMEDTHDFSLTTGTPQILITHILYHLKEDHKNIIEILNNEGSDIFLRFFQDYLNRLLSARMLEGIDWTQSKIPYDFLLNHISASFVNMMKWWLNNEYEKSPEELAEYFSVIIDPIIGQI
ncbi:MAG: TetR/AcrR family transcriptional regulator [Lachnospiraceae bacterium]|nr:TetR/AcrR family transcriptional regulator [Lachnospiraceae bacterium]